MGEEERKPKKVGNALSQVEWIMHSMRAHTWGTQRAGHVPEHTINLCHSVKCL